MLMLDRERETTAGSGRAEIEFGRAPDGRTFVNRQFASYPFHVCRPHSFAGDPEGMATLYLQSLSGGIYEDERLALSIIAEAGTRAQVTSQAATIVHSMTTGRAELTVSIEAKGDALVEYLPDPLILFPGARLDSAIRIRRDPAATVICADAFLAHDPEAADRTFNGLDSRLDVEDRSGRLLARDRFVLSGDSYRARAARERGYAALTTLVVMTEAGDRDAMLNVLRDALSGLPETYAGTSLLPNDCGLWARILTTDGVSLRTAMHAAWAAAREAITGTRPQGRRK